MTHPKTSPINNQKGFTLVEIIAVLIILGILAAVAVPRYIDLEANARDKAIDAAIAELNGRANLHWANVKIGPGWPGDSDLFNGNATAGIDPFDYDLGGEYEWVGGAPDETGGELCFQCPTSPPAAGDGVVLTRNTSQDDQPAVWTR